MELFDVYEGSPKPEDNVSNDPIFHFALAVDYARAAVEHVRIAGCEITVEPIGVNLSGLNVTLAFLKGPSGESIEFFQTC